MVSDNR
jgi:hypothetical protein